MSLGSRLAAHAALLSLAAGLAGCGGGKTGEPGVAAKEAETAAKPSPKNEVFLGPEAPELKQMVIEAVRKVPVALDEVTATARIEANPNRIGRAMIPVPGRIASVLVKLGDTVTKGQPLLSIESSTVGEAETAFVQAESAVRQARIALSKTETDLVRVTDLYEHQAVAQKEVLAAKTTHELTKASLEQSLSARDQARHRLELLGLKPGEFQQRIVIHSPLSGKVMEVDVVEGEFRNEINAPVVTITDLSRVWVASEVPESKIRQFRVGGVAYLDLIAYPGEPFQARITRIADSVNNETRTIKVNAELDNPNGRFRPDMFGSMRYALALGREADQLVAEAGNHRPTMSCQRPGSRSLPWSASTARISPSWNCRRDAFWRRRWNSASRIRAGFRY